MLGQVAFGPGASGRVLPGQPVGDGEAQRIGQPAILVFLQPHPLAAGHLGQFGQRKNQQLAIAPDHGNMIPGHRLTDHRARPILDVQHLAPAAGLGDDLVRSDDKAVPCRRGNQQPLAGPVNYQRHQIIVIGQIDHQAQRLAHAAPAGQPVGPQGVEAPIGGEGQQPVGGLGVEDEAGLVAILVFQLAIQCGMALHGADPALGRADHGDRLLHRHVLDHRSIGKSGAPRAQRIIRLRQPGGGNVHGQPQMAHRQWRAEAVAHGADLVGDTAPLQGLVRQQVLQIGALTQQCIALAL